LKKKHKKFKLIS